MGASASSKKSFLQVLPGGRQVSGEVAGMRVVVAREDDPPFSVDAQILEEDTWLALSTPAETIVAPGHPVRVMTQVWEAQPQQLGGVIVQEGTPLRMLAVVHDLNREPSWSEAIVQETLARIFAEASDRRLRALRLPLLGTHYGQLPPRSFLRMLRSEIQRAAGKTTVRALWLVRGNECGAELLDALTNDAAAPLGNS